MSNHLFSGQYLVLANGPWFSDVIGTPNHTGIEWNWIPRFRILPPNLFSFERSPPRHFVIVSDISSGSIYGIYFLTFFSDIFFLAFYLYSILASYLASFLAFFLTFSLAFYVILCGILSDNLSGICPGILPGISCGTLSGILSDIHSFWHMYLAYLLTFFLHSIWYIFGDSLWLRSGRDN